ncbi:MAG: RNA polymerase sigma factor [Desulforhopalus sp.]
MNLEKAETYQQFYLDYRHKLFSYLLYRSGDPEVASDIMQESFTRHFKHYGRQAPISPSLLFTIARNTLVDYQRGVTRFYRADIPAEKAVPDEESSFLEKEESAAIRQAMAALPAQDMEILTLAVGGMAYKEIAALLGLSVAAVKVRVHRARTKLRTMLNSGAE